MTLNELPPSAWLGFATLISLILIDIGLLIYSRYRTLKGFNDDCIEHRTRTRQEQHNELIDFLKSLNKYH